MRLRFDGQTRIAVGDGRIDPGRHMSLESSTSVLAARAVVAALRDRGVDPAQVLRSAGISGDVLTSVESRLPRDSVERLWEASAKAARDPSFGLHVAETLPVGAYDVFEHILSAAETVAAGFARIQDYFPLFQDHATMKLVVEPAHARLVRRGPTLGPQHDEFSLALLLVRSRQATGIEWKPERVTFQHERAHDDGEPSRIFGCPVLFGAAETEVLIPPPVLRLPHTRADPALLAILCGHVDPLLQTLPPRGELLARVARAIATRIATELPTLATTAAMVRIPERTLQRRLADEGVTHSVLVDEVRRNLALEYLGDASVSVTEIAYRLQFADPAAFYRAFKRWTGESPLAYRRRFL